MYGIVGREVACWTFVWDMWMDAVLVVIEVWACVGSELSQENTLCPRKALLRFVYVGRLAVKDGVR